MVGVESDDLRQRAGRAVAEMAMDGVAHHRAQFLDRVALGGDGVAEGRGDKAAIRLVFAHFKDDLAAHGRDYHTRARRRARDNIWESCSS